eukprot:GHVS01097768.1.p1 GENE.GHVS01097768.1~~GHVS01097768.1.p1  ORF type:complete len:152 (+),score=10.77 GHVS01097768.1:295-750(+)
MDTAVEESCQRTKSEYRRCLSLSERNPAKCAVLEAQLRNCAKSLDKTFCIDEGIQLMSCARKGNNQHCGAEFVKLRECNRPRGAQILVEDGHYVVAEPSRDLYHLTDGTSSICREHPSEMSCSVAEMREMLSERRHALHLKNITEQHVAYK